MEIYDFRGTQLKIHCITFVILKIFIIHSIKFHVFGGFYMCIRVCVCGV